MLEHATSELVNNSFVKPVLTEKNISYAVEILGKLTTPKVPANRLFKPPNIPTA